MKKIVLIVTNFLISFLAVAQNCTNTSVGYPPINDLGTGYWHGAMGGLYPNGSNYIPTTHMNAGLNIANNIQPLDTNGNVDASNGSIVWVSLGMSNTTQETQAFIPMTDTFSLKNPKLKLVDCAQGGQAIVQMLDTTGSFWPTVNNRLAAAGKTAAQVQVAWFKQAEISPTDTSFAYADALKNKFKLAMLLCKRKFPNLKLCYLSGRIYAGYATSMLNPEPYAYYSGWSVKRLIEDQINGDSSLTFSGPSPLSAWLVWGPYLWADGLTPRSDGLTWTCPNDFSSDGTHPSTAGRQKVANLLFNFFSTDSTTVPWFLNSTVTGISNLIQDSPITIYPNPTGDEFRMQNAELRIKEMEIFDMLGKKVLSTTVPPFSLGRRDLRDELVFNISSLIPGIYFVKITAENKISVLKLVKQ